MTAMSVSLAAKCRPLDETDIQKELAEDIKTVFTVPDKTEAQRYLKRPEEKHRENLHS